MIGVHAAAWAFAMFRFSISLFSKQYVWMNAPGLALAPRSSGHQHVALGVCVRTLWLRERHREL